MSDSTDNEGYGNLRFSFHDFLVDFLGALVPGILFTVATAAIVTTGAQALIAGAKTPVDYPNIRLAVLSFLEASKDTPSMIWIGAFIFALLLSYVIGHIFYRRDPKTPDRASFKLLHGERPKTESPTREEAWLRKNLACITENDCEFPYPNLADYLEERGHDHLLELVRWARKERWRTKTYINQLKIRLNFYHPDKYRRIIRNEAHVRLATSTWYLAGALRWASIIGVGLAFLGLSFAWYRDFFSSFWDGMAWAIPPLIAPITVLSISEYARRSCERFIHYQRLREVFYVLELAYTAFRDRPDQLDSPPLRIGRRKKRRKKRK